MSVKYKYTHTYTCLQYKVKNIQMCDCVGIIWWQLCVITQTFVHKVALCINNHHAQGTYISLRPHKLLSNHA